jgi:hypothetical protein
VGREGFEPSTLGLREAPEARQPEGSRVTLAQRAWFPCQGVRPLSVGRVAPELPDRTLGAGVIRLSPHSWGRSPIFDTGGPIWRACIDRHLASDHSRTREEWEDLGAEVILDVLGDAFAAPWSEIEARISVRGWKNFERVQPVQLSGARRRLRAEGKIIEEASNHAPSPVRMLRLPYVEGFKREQERLLGRGHIAMGAYRPTTAAAATTSAHTMRGATMRRLRAWP